MKNIVISFLLLAAFAHPAISMDKETGSYGADSLLVGQDSLSGKFHIKDRLLPSYGTLSSDDTNLMLLLDDLDFKGSVFTVNPSVGYFFRDNMCVGTRFGYSKVDGNLGNISLDLGSDAMNLSLSDILMRSQVMNMGVFLRSYAGVDQKGIFGLFAELELMYKVGNSMFSYRTASGPNTTNTNNNQLRLGISAGVAVYIMPKICCNLSFGLGGISFNRIRQHDAAGLYTGGRTATSMNWKLNLLDIGIGFNVHL